MVVASSRDILNNPSAKWHCLRLDTSLAHGQTPVLEDLLTLLAEGLVYQSPALQIRSKFDTSEARAVVQAPSLFPAAPVKASQLDTFAHILTLSLRSKKVGGMRDRLKDKKLFYDNDVMGLSPSCGENMWNLLKVQQAWEFCCRPGRRYCQLRHCLHMRCQEHGTQIQIC